MTPVFLWAGKDTNLALGRSYSHQVTLCGRVHRQGQDPDLVEKVFAIFKGEVHPRLPMHNISPFPLLSTIQRPPNIARLIV